LKEQKTRYAIAEKKAYLVRLKILGENKGVFTQEIQELIGNYIFAYISKIRARYFIVIKSRIDAITKILYLCTQKK